MLCTGKVCRLLTLAAYGALVIDQAGKPCFPPADYNDVWSRFDTVNGEVTVVSVMYTAAAFCD